MISARWRALPRLARAVLIMLGVYALILGGWLVVS